MPDRELPETLRMEIFQALVEAQDQGMPVSESKKLVAGRFGVASALTGEALRRDNPPARA